MKTVRRIRKAIVTGLVGEGGVFATLGFDYDNPQFWIASVVVPFVTGFLAYLIPNETEPIVENGDSEL